MTRTQADKLRLLASEPMRSRPGLGFRPLSIVIASGKGGVGKTTVAVNLSVALSDLGVACGLIDADLALADAHMLFGFRPSSDISDVVRREQSPVRALSKLPDGPWILAGVNGDPDMASLGETERTKLIKSFSEISSPFRVLLLDAAAGAGPDITDFALWSDKFVLVTIPDPTAILDAYGLIKVYHLRGGKGPVGVIVNRVKQRDDHTGMIAALRSTAQGFLGMDIEDYGAIPEDAAAADAITMRRPLVRVKPRAPASKAIRKIAERIRGQLPFAIKGRSMREESARLYQNKPGD